MSIDVKEVLVRKSIVIDAPVEHVFNIFTTRLDAWWPHDKHIGKSTPFTAILEPRVGGRWFERGEDGVECNWGRVLIWEPPHRLVMSWDISSTWQYDENVATEVAVRFIQESEQTTRVELEHTRLEWYGDQAEMMRALLDSPNGWAGILAAFAKVAEV